MALISAAKRAANRANAARSTGPRSEDGKNVVRFNAVKHGMCAEHAVLPGEREAEFEALHAGMVQRLAPADPAERHLVDCAARELWRLRRGGLSETGALSQLANPYLLQSEGDEPVKREVYVLGETLRQDFAEGGFVEKLSRYESRSGRALERHLRLLQRLRSLAAAAEADRERRKAAPLGVVRPSAAPKVPEAPAPAAEPAPAPVPSGPISQFSAEFGFVPQNRAGLLGSVSHTALALAELTRAPEIRWPPGWPRAQGG